MGIILDDLVRKDQSEFCNWWNWRPTLALIAQSGVIDSDRLERMGYNGGGAEISAQEARRIADFVESEVIPEMRTQDEVKLDGRISDEPRWIGPISKVPDEQQLYGASRDWLVSAVEIIDSAWITLIDGIRSTAVRGLA